MWTCPWRFFPPLLKPKPSSRWAQRSCCEFSTGTCSAHREVQHDVMWQPSKRSCWKVSYTDLLPMSAARFLEYLGAFQGHQRFGHVYAVCSTLSVFPHSVNKCWEVGMNSALLNTALHFLMLFHTVLMLWPLKRRSEYHPGCSTQAWLPQDWAMCYFACVV